MKLLFILLICLCSCKQSSNELSLVTDKSLEGMTIPKVVKVILDKDTFSAPDFIEAGYTTIRYTNNTDEMHSAHLIKLDEGYTSDQLIKAYKESSLKNTARPDWMTHIGGVISERGTSEVSLLLEPGHYTWVCVMGSDEAPHFEEIEKQNLIVSGETDNSYSLKKPDVVVNMTDSIHKIQGELKAGTHTIKINNVGTGYHLLAISKLNEGATAQDLIDWFKTYQGPPPAQNILSTSAIGPGLSARINPNFEKGNYVFYCMANAEGRFHLLDGAITTLNIR